MAKVMTSEDLIRSLKRRALIPTDQSTFTDDDFLEILDEEVDTGLLPYLLEQHEEHLVTFVEVDATNDNNRYKIPYRATGNKLRDVAYIDASGNPYEMTRISLEEISDYNTFYTVNRDNAFYIEGDEFVVVSIYPKQSAKFRIYFYMRPSKLVKLDQVGVVNGIDRVAGTISISNFPSDFSNLPDMDFVGARTPNKIKAFDLTPVSVNANAKSVTFAAADIPADLEVGDYLCKAEETPVPQVPTELHPILAQRGAVHCLESLGDTEGLANATNKLEKMEKAVMNIIEDRVEGAPQKINPRHTTLRDSMSRYPGGRKGRG